MNVKGVPTPKGIGIGTQACWYGVGGDFCYLYFFHP
jgi:hypothetical protein